MAVAMEETYLSRSGDSKGRKVDYIVTGTDDDAVALDYVEANAPSTHDGLVFRTVSRLTQQSDMRWIATCAYGKLFGTAAVLPEPASGTAAYSFSAIVEPERVLYSPYGVEGFPRKYPANAPSFANGHIGLQLADGQGRHEGIEIPAGPVTDEVTYEYPAAVIPTNYRTTVRGLIGGVNDATFLGNPIGTTRLVGVRAQLTSDTKQSITFSFSYRRNQATRVGGYNLGTVEGWDFVWSYDETFTFSDPDGREVPVVGPKFVYVERLLPRVSMASLGLPSF